MCVVRDACAFVQRSLSRLFKIPLHAVSSRFRFSTSLQDSASRRLFKIPLRAVSSRFRFAEERIQLHRRLRGVRALAEFGAGHDLGDLAERLDVFVFFVGW